MSYQIDNRPLSVIRRDIKDSILAKIQAEREAGGRLESIQNVVYGDRVDAGVVDEMPTLWILPVPHQPDLKGGHTAIHDFIFDFIVMVYNSDNPEEGKDQAEDLTAVIYDIINEMRRTQSTQFFDVRPLNYDPVFEAAANSAVYWSSCEFAFRIQRRE